MQTEIAKREKNNISSSPKTLEARMQYSFTIHSLPHPFVPTVYFSETLRILNLKIERYHNLFFPRSIQYKC